MLETVWAALGRDRAELALVHGPRHPVPLSAVTDVGALAWASVAAASLTAARLAGAAAVDLDPTRVAIVYGSERHFRLDGSRPDAFAALSGFFRTSDGWVRTHANYPWHARALRDALGLADDASAESAARAFSAADAVKLSRTVSDAGGICTPVLAEVPAHDAGLRAAPILRVARLGGGPPAPLAPASPARPLEGVRVLDLTRVIAGPIATRTLALLGADVLRIDPPDHPEIGWQHLDTGHAKRSCVLDARSPAFDALLRTADVVVLGYRPAGMDRIGLAPETLARRRPGIIVARLSAWGADAADRRGFDSIVQAASGISWLESRDGAIPGALPAQALDHSAGYLLAAAVVSLIARRAHEGGSWIADTSLRRVAAELLHLPRTSAPDPGDAPDPTSHLQHFVVDGLALTTTAPALAYAGGPTTFAPPRPWGQDAAGWADRSA
ncbi:CoA transferase [Microbacterium hominis]|uniref:CoA transferase n=2 Tax=Microbacterium hominis TaxID=162426 RepID=A0A7D4TI04_9MICO|nr:CoA transferase [Microbacterium hominis]